MCVEACAHANPALLVDLLVDIVGFPICTYNMCFRHQFKRHLSTWTNDANRLMRLWMRLACKASYNRQKMGYSTAHNRPTLYCMLIVKSYFCAKYLSVVSKAARTSARDFLRADLHQSIFNHMCKQLMHGKSDK